MKSQKNFNGKRQVAALAFTMSAPDKQMLMLLQLFKTTSEI
jgi:hypothetical protein